MAVELITQAAYSRRRGVTHEAVRRAIKTGRISTVERNGKQMIDPDVADIQWAQNTDPRQAQRANARKGGAMAPPAGPGKAAGREEGAYWSARTRREEADAARAEIELEKLRGSVADREGMHRAAMALGRMLRDSMLGIPPKVAPEYAGMTDPFEIERHLDAAIRRILDDVAALTVDDLARGASQ